jgi:hypothetical protein
LYDVYGIMFKRLIRYIKRLAVFAPGIVIAYVSVEYTLPFFDRRLPIAFGITATYMLAAYVLIPSIIRLWRIIAPAKHLPLYCITPDGFASDPLNIGLVSTRFGVIEAMQKAGWHMADPYTFQNCIKQVLSVVFGHEYLTGPMSSLYMFGRKQDLAFEIPVNGSTRNRHHVRFWATTFSQGTPIVAKNIDWRHRKAHLQDDRLLWVGAASLDTGVRPIRHNWQITHMVHPDTNQERDLIVSGLNSKELIETTEKLKLGNPYKLINRTWRGELHTDGVMKVVKLKDRKSLGR